MKKSFLKKSLRFSVLILLSSALLFSCKKDDSNVVIIDNADAVEVNFEDAATNIRVVPLICDTLLHGCSELQSFGNDLFMLSENHQVIYYFRNDSLFNILNSVGRGRGEYLTIEQFTYDPNKGMLYVIPLNSKKILWYSIPDMRFHGETDLPYKASAFAVHDDKTFLVSCSTDSIFTLNYINKESGSIIQQVQIIEGYAFNAFNRTLLGYTINNHTYSILGYRNVIISINEKMKPDTIFEYSFGKKNIPQKYFDYDPNDVIEIINEALFFTTDIANNYLRGGYFLKKEDKQISFWYSNAKNVSQKEYFYYKHTNKKDVNLKGFKVPGLNCQIIPKCITEDGYVAIFEGLSDSYIDKGSDFSPLAKEIITVMNNRTDENPILVYFSM